MRRTVGTINKVITSVAVKDTLSEWEKDLESRLAAQTVRNRLLYIRHFAAVCSTSKHQLMTGDVGPDESAKLFAGYSVASSNACLVALKDYCGWCVRKHYMTADQVTDIIGVRKNGKFNRQPKICISVDEWPLALEVAGKWHPQRRLVVALGIFTGCRQSEIKTIQLQHVNLHDQVIDVFRWKRDRWTKVTITLDLLPELESWLAWYAEHQGYTSADAMMDAHPDWYLVPCLTWCRRYIVTPDKRSGALEDVAKGVFDRMEIETTAHGKYKRHKQEGMHTFRRSGARAMYDQLSEVEGDEKALLHVQLWLDHDDPKMTLRYLGMDIEKERLDQRLRGMSMLGKKPSEGGNVYRPQFGGGRHQKRAI